MFQEQCSASKSTLNSEESDFNQRQGVLGADCAAQCDVYLMISKMAACRFNERMFVIVYKFPKTNRLTLWCSKIPDLCPSSTTNYRIPRVVQTCFYPLCLIKLYCYMCVKGFKSSAKCPKVTAAFKVHPTFEDSVIHRLTLEILLCIISPTKTFTVHPESTVNLLDFCGSSSKSRMITMCLK